MNARDGRWNAKPQAIAVPMPYAFAPDFAPMREKLAMVRDTLIVLGMQLAFRASVWLRHLNY
jgi:hypothetical protein